MILYQSQNSVHAYNIDVLIYHNLYYIAHIHRDFELIYVLDGEVNAYIDGKCQTLTAGEFCLILQNQVHSFETPAASTVWVCVFAADYVRDFAAAVNHCTCGENRFVMNEKDRQFLVERLVRAQPNRLELIAYFSFCCALFYKDRTFRKISGSETGLLYKILDYINAHYTENISQTDMARALGYEPHYLSRCFNSFFGKNFKRFLHEYRIGYAKQRMMEGKEEGKENISKIALDCGFQSIRNFNRVFRSLENETPRQAQKRLTESPGSGDSADA